MRVEAILDRRETWNSGVDGAPDPLTEVRSLAQTLVARGHWELLEGSPQLEDDCVVLRDPKRGARYRLRLTPPAARAPEELPVPVIEEGTLPPRVTRATLASPGELVNYDRILSPREIITKMERFLGEVAAARSVTFHPLELGTDSEGAGPEGPPEERRREALPLESGTLEDLSRRRDRIYRWTRRGHGLARLVLAIGDDTLGWRGVIVLESDTDFDEERILASVWTASHYESLLSTVLRLQGLIFYDFLTGVYNRSFYEDQLDRELQLARRRQEPLALLLLDIDNFKEFNTRYGYEGGDRVLATVACVVKSALRGTDTLARYGGEEFVVILAPPVSAEEAFRIADRLRQAVEQEPFHLPDFAGNEVTARATVSIGGALYPQHGESRAALWTASNIQLLEAKEQGKNRVLFPD